MSSEFFKRSDDNGILQEFRLEYCGKYIKKLMNSSRISIRILAGNAADYGILNRISADS